MFFSFFLTWEDLIYSEDIYVCTCTYTYRVREVGMERDLSVGGSLARRLLACGSWRKPNMARVSFWNVHQKEDAIRSRTEIQTQRLRYGVPGGMLTAEPNTY